MMQLDIEIVIRYIKGEASLVESVQVKKWIRVSEKHALLYEKIQQKVQAGDFVPVDASEVDKLWSTLRGKIILREKRSLLVRRGVWCSTVAAVLLVGILCGWLLPDFWRMEKEEERVSLASELTGTRIVLQDGQVVPVTDNMKTEALVVAPLSESLPVREADSLEFNTLIVAPGDMMRLTLSDGTMVVLNGGSTLTYPTSFPAQAREVVLTGEGYFEVTPDRQRFFVVKTKEVDIRVLGTRFNVCGYAEDDVFTTTLLEGSVSIENRTSGKVSAMRPGEVYNYMVAENSEQVDLENGLASIAWLERRIACHKQTLGQLLARIERMYSVEIRLDDDVDESIVLDCDLPSYEDYLELLRVICDVSDTKLLIKEKEVVVMVR